MPKARYTKRTTFAAYISRNKLPTAFPLPTKAVLQAQLKISSGSISTYHRATFLYCAYCTLDDLEPHRSATLRSFCQYLQTEISLGTSTIITYAAVVRALAVLHNWPDLLSFSLKEKRPDSPTRALTDVELHRLLNTAKNDARAYLMIRLMACAGLRRSEVAGLRVKDVDYIYSEDLTSLAVEGKGRVLKEIIYLDSVTGAALRRHVLASNSPFVFPSCAHRSHLSSRRVGDVVSSYLYRSGIRSKNVTPHSLRHTFARIAKDNGLAIELIQAAMRHKSIRTTEYYLRKTRPLPEQMATVTARVAEVVDHNPDLL